jgi:hypothetical protein
VFAIDRDAAAIQFERFVLDCGLDGAVFRRRDLQDF